MNVEASMSTDIWIASPQRRLEDAFAGRRAGR